MNELALFAGAGGGILGGVLLGWRTVCAVEIDPYCRRVLMQRQNDGVLAPFPIWDDVRTFDGRAWRGRVDVVTAGFPCQPFSLAGQRRGEDDERNLWPETIRCLREIRPRWALLENVPGLLVHEYFGTVLRDLAESGFDARWGVLSAAGCGAPHQRKRLWVVADASFRRLEGCSFVHGMCGTSCAGRDGELAGGGPEMAYAAGRNATDTESDDTERTSSAGIWRGLFVEPRRSGWWSAEPDVGRVADGVAHRVDRLRALGNGQVPAVARAAWLSLTQDRKPTSFYSAAAPSLPLERSPTACQNP